MNIVGFNEIVGCTHNSKRLFDYYVAEAYQFTYATVQYPGKSNNIDCLWIV